jgi:arylsulfatase A-like enzyme
MKRDLSRRQFLKMGTFFLASSLLGHRLRGAPGKVLSRPRHEEPRPNILIIVFDALSAKNMSLYGYPRRTTPSIERFAERATVFHRHYAAANFTTPGVASIVTGTYPWTHRAFNHAGTLIERCREQNLFSAFATEGYHTIAYSHNQLADSILNQCNDHIGNQLPYTSFSLYAGEISDGLFESDADVVWRSFEDLILQRGENAPSSLFLSLPDRLRMALHRRIRTRGYRESYPLGLPTLFKMTFTLEDVMEGVERVIADAPVPYIGYFHLLPPHEPYMPHAEFVGCFDDDWEPEPKPESRFSEGVSVGGLNDLRRHYDEFLAYADDRFNRLMASLDAGGHLENTVVVFTSDHGQLFERGIHGHVTSTLYEPVIHVPLLISTPGQSSRKDVYNPTSCTDLVPTLLNIAGLEPPDWCEGKALSLSREPESERVIFAVEAKGNPKQAPLETATFAVMTDSHKLVRYMGYDGSEDISELYDLSLNPDERVDFCHGQPRVASQLRDILEEQTQGY